MSSSSRIDKEMKRGIEEKVFPGAALLVASRGKVVYRNFFGGATERTIFDIASLTKPVATAAIALSAVRERKLKLNSSVSRFTLQQLLDHTSGLPAWRPYFEEIAREHPDSVGKRESRKYYLEKISKEPIEGKAGQKRVYSDLGFILLGIFLEDTCGSPLDQLFAEKVSDPFGMKDTFYVPVGARRETSRPDNLFTATGQSVWRNKLIQGEVHDDNAYTLGGVAGHAGLFSTVDDLHLFLTAWKKSGPANEIKLGWDSPNEQNSQAGSHFSKNSIGHLGFTGCSFWLDLDRDFCVILLTNRVHPSSQNEAIKKFRPILHDIIYEELIKG